MRLRGSAGLARLDLVWLGLIDASQAVISMRAEGMHHDWTKLFITVFLSWILLVLATPLVIHLGQQYPVVSVKAWSHWFIHLGVCAAVCLTSAAFVAVLEDLLNPWANASSPGPFLPLWMQRFAGSMVAYLIFYASILAIGYVLASQQRLAAQQTVTARLNEQLSRAHLDALRRRIEPHFIFNALNAISGLVREKRTEDAVSMIAGLSDFLRHVVQDSNRHQVPLREEMEFLQKYLEIQKLRFADRLQIRVEVPEELLPVEVPILLLQPIVENAIKHGIAKRSQGGEIHIVAARCDATLHLTVYNDGPSLSSNWQQTRMGVGISNLQTRKPVYGGWKRNWIRNFFAAFTAPRSSIWIESELCKLAKTARARCCWKMKSSFA